MFSRLNNEVLAKIAVFTGMVTVSTGMLFQWKARDRVKSSDYYKDALQILRKHHGSIYLLGEPIKDGNFKMNNTNNFCDGVKANFEIPVYGSKERGTMYFWASRPTIEENWTVDKVELELKKDPSKRLSVKNTVKE